MIPGHPATESAEALAHEHPHEIAFSASLVFLVAEARVQRLVLGHFLVGVEVDRLEARPAGVRLGELDQRPADAAALERGVDGDVLDREPLVGRAPDEQPDDRAAAFDDCGVAVPDDVAVVLRIGPGRRPSRWT